MGKKFEDFTYPVDGDNWEAISAGIPSGTEGGFLHEKFAAHKFAPSRGVWQEIAAVINPQSGIRIAAWWYGAAAAVFLFGYLAFLNYNDVESQTYISRDQSKSQNSTSASTMSDSTKQSEEDLASQKSNAASISASAKANTATTTAGETVLKIENETAQSDNSFAEKAGLTNQTDQSITNRKSGMPISEQKLARAFVAETHNIRGEMWAEKIPAIGIDFPERMVVAQLSGQILESGLEISFADKSKQKESRFYDGTEPASSNTFSVLASSQLAFAGGSSGEQDNFLFNLPGASNELTPGGVIEEVAPASVAYSTPVYYGVNGEILFWKRFSAGLGLGYLNMKSNADYYFPAQERVAEVIENRYLSIPVYVKFNFINKPKFTAYTTVGNALDIMIWQKTTADFYVNEKLRLTTGTTQRKNGNQANVYAGLGMSFKFTKNLGVFAEGSAMRYYHNSSTNFFSQKNVWPGLKFGLLVTF